MSHSWPLRASVCTPSRAFFSIMHPVRVQAGGISYAQEWVPYQHEDGHDSHRWTPKECFQYLENRPWDEVLKFYSLVAAGKFSLSDLTLSRQSQVSRTFHPTFSAQWRRYVYILPLHNVEEKRQCLFQQNDTNFGRNGTGEAFDVMAVNEMLSQLEGQQLSFTVFARDTKASRSRGPPTECYIHHARAAIAELPLMEQESKKRREVMCVELVANRFLRKMVRVLVATSVREAAAGAPSNMLVRLTGASCRRASAPPAPACGLCLTEVSYGNFSAASLLINRIL